MILSDVHHISVYHNLISLYTRGPLNYQIIFMWKYQHNTELKSNLYMILNLKKQQLKSGV